MSPEEIKTLRIRLGYTQVQFAETLGLVRLSVSQYETGFREPGSTMLILFRVLDSLPKKKALWLLELFKSQSKNSSQKRKDSKA